MTLHTPHSRPADAATAPPLLAPGETCWRLAGTDGFGVIVDCEDYFAAFRQACLKARHRIFLVGWDFDARIRLVMEDPRDGWPVKVGAFLSALVKRRPELHIYILKWDVAFFSMIRQNPWPVRAIQWKLSKRVHFKLDGEHPMGSCHHQKIICIDDRFALVGSIDITRERWDTRAHRDHERRRVTPGGIPYRPHHDAALAVDGEAADVLAQLCRERWRRATGEELDPCTPAGRDAPPFPWPDSAPRLANGLTIGIARTLPPFEDQPGIFEIEKLTLRAITQARRLIYLENQYFASRAIVRALVGRLRGPDPPEVVVINPAEADGWVEQATMDTARVSAVAACREADHAGRFRIYRPVTRQGRPIYVHAKVTVIDDRVLKVGSANINNRSMGFDSECDVAVAPAEDDSPARGMIRDVLIDLLAEHLDVPKDEVRRRIDTSDGRIIPAIEALRRDTGRTLVPLEVKPPDDMGDLESFLVDTQIADPERPEKPWRLLRNKLRRALGIGGA
ncbi:phospholipase D-like domain-containing protein [Novispirillum sp. DQ9]|uniref:phospholipase D-like domain-containing protein n=1 Tax=Novispirillum sp. DQ9 TaxID=3398612 RepID=UPI003C7AF121